MREWREKAERTAAAGTSRFFPQQKTPADRGKSVNGGRGDVVFRWELLQSEPDGSASSLGEGGCLRSRLGKLTFTV